MQHFMGIKLHIESASYTRNFVRLSAGYRSAKRGKSGQQRAAYRLMAGFSEKSEKEKVPQKITVR